MKRTRRHQRGYVFKKGSAWYLRYYDHVMGAAGEAEHKQKCRRLADAVGRYRTKQAAWELAEEFLRSLNDGTATPESSMTLLRYVEDYYLPHVEEQKRLSTYKGYVHMWSRHLKGRSLIALRDFRTVDGENMLRSIARTESLNRTSLAHLKSFLSGALRYARRQGILNAGENPMRDVVVPKARPSSETHAYSLEDIMKMLVVVPEPAATALATAAFTGARRGEIRGMLWENYSGDQIRITQSVFGSHADEPKTAKSKAPVPVIAPLAKYLDRHRVVSGESVSGLIFKSKTGTPMDLAQIARFVIRPALNGTGIEWHGWHAFRRGLATNLYRLGVPDKTIQAILRHANLSTTMNAYVKSVSADATAAMKAFEDLCNQHATEAEPRTWQ
jgi:integrase